MIGVSWSEPAETPADGRAMDDFNRIVRDGVTAGGGRSVWDDRSLGRLAAQAHALGPDEFARLVIECQAEPVAVLIDKLRNLVSLRDWKVPHGER
ncbi:MAG: hypothetical protein E6Q98_15930 [Rhodospirillaceae bacterium]|nr:MAG: hypothetical protein E6Q98_15930 [Rhodospirillaceae bacterium]